MYTRVDAGTESRGEARTKQASEGKTKKENWNPNLNPSHLVKRIRSTFSNPEQRNIRPSKPAT